MFRTTWRVLIAVTFVAFSGCSPRGPTLVGVQRSDFPRDLDMPVLSGSVDSAVDLLCEWAQRNRVPTRPEVMERVFVNSIRTVPDLPMREFILQSFLGAGAVPQVLALEAGPEDFESYRRVVLRLRAAGESSQWHEQRLALYETIDRPGLWVFEKFPREACEAQASTGILIPTDSDVRLCVATRRLDVVPSDLTQVDYRTLIFDVEFVAVRQDVSVRIASYYRGDRLVGRTIDATADALPTAVGVVARACTPRPSLFRVQPRG